MRRPAALAAAVGFAAAAAGLPPPLRMQDPRLQDPPPPPPLRASADAGPGTGPEPEILPPVADGKPVLYASGLVVVPSAAKTDIDFKNGANWAGSRKGKGYTDIRSGGPGGVGEAYVDHPIEGGGKKLSRVTMTYQYVAGYDCGPGTGKPCDGPPIMLLVATDAGTGEDLEVLYTSPPLNGYSYDKYTDYSPPVHVDVGVSNVPAGIPVQLVLRFKNNKHNLQLLLDPQVGLDLKVEWGTPGGSSGGCDGGCAFLIIFFCGGFTYFAAGALINYKRHEKRGVDVVPHLEFWKDVPSLVKDGAGFAVQKVRGGYTTV